MYGVMNVAGDFKEIKASAELENRFWETFKNVPSFYTFSHRGRFLNPSYSNYKDDDEWLQVFIWNTIVKCMVQIENK